MAGVSGRVEPTAMWGSGSLPPVPRGADTVKLCRHNRLSPYERAPHTRCFPTSKPVPAGLELAPWSRPMGAHREIVAGPHPSSHTGVESGGKGPEANTSGADLDRWQLPVKSIKTRQRDLC